MMQLLVARACLDNWGYETDLWPVFHARTILGVRLAALVTDAPPSVVTVALPGARWEWFGSRRAFF